LHRFHDPNEISVDRSNLLRQILNRLLQIQCAGHRPAARTLQNGHSSLFSQTRNETALEGVTFAFRTSGELPFSPSAGLMLAPERHRRGRVQILLGG
jgi:hypothetical protein